MVRTRGPWRRTLWSCTQSSLTCRTSPYRTYINRLQRCILPKAYFTSLDRFGPQFRLFFLYIICCGDRVAQTHEVVRYPPYFTLRVKKNVMLVPDSSTHAVTCGIVRQTAPTRSHAYSWRGPRCEVIFIPRILEVQEPHAIGKYTAPGNRGNFLFLRHR